MTDFNNTEIFNRYTATGEPVTVGDAVQHELDNRDEVEARYHTQEAKKEMSNTDTGAMVKQLLLNDVEKALVEQIEAQTTNGGGKASWWKRNDFKRPNPAKKNSTLGTIKTSLAADLALMVVLDGTSKEWTLRKLTDHLGHMHSCLLFAETMNANAVGRRMIRRMDKDVTEKTKDGVRRGDIVWRKAAQWGFDLSIWTESEKVKVGYVLLNSVLAGTNLIDVVLEKRDGDHHLTKYTVFTDEAKQLIAEHRDLLASFSSSYPPMLHPPRDWNADNIGPYLTMELAAMIKLVRNMSPEQEAEIERRRKNNDLTAVEEAINFIQAVPYTINTFVVGAVNWTAANPEKADELKKFPDLVEAAAIAKMDATEFKALPKEEQMDRGREYQSVQSYNRTVTANDATVNRLTGLASRLANVERFWLPHNLDYRGRIYPIPDFNHHNSDYIRAMFLFASGNPIGDNEAKLAIHLANTFGNDKITLDERVEWTQRNAELIYRTGENYQASYPFWRKASEPFQFLAACREWYNYKNEGKGYICRLPIAKDATQSGVQHLSAACLNPSDGHKVNLTDNVVPFDFYQACLDEAKTMVRSELAEMKRKRDANPWTAKERQTVDAYVAFQAQELPDDLEAAMELASEKDENHTKFKKTTAYQKRQLDRDIDAAERLIALGDEYNRGVMKRNAMTHSYSSRQFGFAEQLRSDWMSEFTKDVRQGKRKEHPFGKDRGYHAAFYIGGLHERAIEETISATTGAMTFFQDVATVLAEDRSDADIAADVTNKKKFSGRHIRFENRMGFPMYQYYRHGSTKSQKVSFFDRKSKGGEYNSKSLSYYRRFTDKVKADKTTDGISPNLIHSQDGCHLMMTALAMKDAGASNFMVIHDSFATDIAHVDTMERVLREQFVDLYSDYNLFEDVLAQARARHSDPDSTRVKKQISDLEVKLETAANANVPDEAAIKDLQKAIEDLQQQIVVWPQVPKQGQNGVLLDLNEVLLSKYFFN